MDLGLGFYSGQPCSGSVVVVVASEAERPAVAVEIGRVNDEKIEHLKLAILWTGYSHPNLCFSRSYQSQKYR